MRKVEAIACGRHQWLGLRDGHCLCFTLSISIAYYFLHLTTAIQKKEKGAHEEVTG